MQASRCMPVLANVLLPWLVHCLGPPLSAQCHTFMPAGYNTTTTTSSLPSSEAAPDVLVVAAHQNASKPVSPAQWEWQWAPGDATSHQGLSKASYKATLAIVSDKLQAGGSLSVLVQFKVGGRGECRTPCTPCSLCSIPCTARLARSMRFAFKSSMLWLPRHAQWQ